MMRLVIVVLFCTLCVPGYAGIDDDMRVVQLQARVNALQAEYNTKLSQLQDCEKNTKGFKIAGISTLVTTGVGVYANIKMAQSENGGGSGGAVVQSFTAAEQKEAEKELCEKMPDVCQ